MFRLFDSNYQAMNPVLEEGANILWLGDCTAAFDRATLDLKGIRTVLTVATGLNVSYPEGGITHKVTISSRRRFIIFWTSKQPISQGFFQTHTLKSAKL